MVDQLFRPLGAAVEKTTPANARLIQVSADTLVQPDVLLVPDLLEITAVSIGGVDIPLEIEERYIKEGVIELAGPDCWETVKVPIIQLVETSRGPAIQRSVKSNDGVWQLGATVVVTGKFGKAKPEGDKKPEGA